MKQMEKKLSRALAREYGVPAESCENAARALLSDVVDGCAELGIDPLPEIRRFVKAYTHPVYVRLARNCGNPMVLPGIFSSYEKASQRDTYEVDHIHHVVKEEGSSAYVRIYEEEDHLRIGTLVSSVPDDGMVEIPGIRVVPSGRQICGFHPVDPRFYILSPRTGLPDEARMGGGPLMISAEPKEKAVTPITGCHCRYQWGGGQCSREGGAELATKVCSYMGTHTDCNAMYHGGMKSCGDAIADPDMIKLPPEHISRPWHFGIVMSSDNSRLAASLPDEPFRLLAAWSWLVGEGPSCYYMYARAVAWPNDDTEAFEAKHSALLDVAFGRGSEPNQIPELREISPDEMRKTLSHRKRRGAYETLSRFGLRVHPALAAGCEVYHTENDWAVYGSPALVDALVAEEAP